MCGGSIFLRRGRGARIVRRRSLGFGGGSVDGGEWQRRGGIGEMEGGGQIVAARIGVLMIVLLLVVMSQGERSIGVEAQLTKEGRLEVIEIIL